MPLYEYQCRACGTSFEILRRIQDSERDLQCPGCHSDEVQQVFSTFSAGGCSMSRSGKFR
jgi:putative FmdB family regulatory protein